MKNKLAMTVTVAVVLVVGALLFASHQMPAQTNSVSSTGSKILYYACPMHPDKHYDKPGDCPICGMKLQPVYEAAKDTNAPAAAGCCAMSCPMTLGK